MSRQEFVIRLAQAEPRGEGEGARRPPLGVTDRPAVLCSAPCPSGVRSWRTRSTACSASRRGPTTRGHRCGEGCSGLLQALLFCASAAPPAPAQRPYCLSPPPLPLERTLPTRCPWLVQSYGGYVAHQAAGAEPLRPTQLGALPPLELGGPEQQKQQQQQQPTAQHQQQQQLLQQDEQPDVEAMARCYWGSYEQASTELKRLHFERLQRLTQLTFHQAQPPS